MPAPYPSTSIRLRIFFGFTAVIVVLAIANLVATSGLRGLDKNTKKLIDITHFVSQANYFSNAIKQQAGALQAFAYSGLNSDLLRVEASRQETLRHKETLIKRLSQAQSAATIEQIEAANIGFNTVFSSIENRLGNTSSAVNVGLNGLLGMGKSSANLVNFLLTQEEPGTALAQQIAPLSICLYELLLPTLPQAKSPISMPLPKQATASASLSFRRKLSPRGCPGGKRAPCVFSTGIST